MIYASHHMYWKAFNVLVTQSVYVGLLCAVIKSWRLMAVESFSTIKILNLNVLFKHTKIVYHAYISHRMGRLYQVVVIDNVSCGISLEITSSKLHKYVRLIIVFLMLFHVVAVLLLRVIRLAKSFLLTGIHTVRYSSFLDTQVLSRASHLCEISFSFPILQL